jgi:hypothetical protein
MPRIFLLDSVTQGEGYYFRYLDGKTPRIKFNVPDPGEYETNVPIEIVKTVSIEIPDKFPRLPPADRDRWKPLKEWYNPEMDSKTSTPIRIFTEPGIIEFGDRFLGYITPIQKFLKLHETGHLFYTSEEYCDMYALVNFIRMGYNQSTAYYALSHILSRSAANVNRLKTLLNNIQKMRQ